MPDEAPVTPPAAPPTSFADFLDRELGDKLSPTPTPEPVAAAPATPVEAPPATAAAPGFVIPDAVTAAVATPPADAALKPAADEVAKEKELDELFKTKAGDAFQKIKVELRDSRKKHADELTALNQQLEEARKNAVAPAEIERLRLEGAEHKRIMDEYERELSLVKVEATREYQETVAKGFEAIKSTVTDFSKKYSVAERSILDALNEADPSKQDAMLTELSGSFHERDRIRLYGLIEKHADVTKQDQLVRSNAKAALAIIENRRNQETAQLKTADATEYTAAMDETVTTLQKDIPFLRPVEGNAEWNTTLTKMVEFARGIDVPSLKPKERAQLVLQGAAMPLMVSAIQFYAGELQKLRSSQTAVAAVTPGAGDGGALSRDPAPATGLGFLDAINQGVTRSGGR